MYVVEHRDVVQLSVNLVEFKDMLIKCGGIHLRIVLHKLIQINESALLFQQFVFCTITESTATDNIKTALVHYHLESVEINVCYFVFCPAVFTSVCLKSAGHQLSFDTAAVVGVVKVLYCFDKALILRFYHKTYGYDSILLISGSFLYRAA